MDKRRAAVAAAAITIGTLLASAGPAAAGTGQAYPGPGFTSSNGSCVGAGLDFSAHYGINGGSYPTITHGTVGPWVSADATSDAPGTVGAFNSAAAQAHGSIDECFS
jgi:hypothetical protein